jgi:cell division protease FtsH
LLGFLPLILIIAVWLFIMRRMSGGGGGGGGGAQIFNIGKSKAKLFDEKTDVKVTFKDVAGLRRSQRRSSRNCRLSKKPNQVHCTGWENSERRLTWWALQERVKPYSPRRLLGRLKCLSFRLSGSDFVEMFVGVGASRVRDLFKQAKRQVARHYFY